MSEDKVVTFNGVTTLDLPPDRVLEAALGKLEGVVLMGYDKEGNEYLASSYADMRNFLWLAERFKMQVLSIEGEE